MMDAINKKSREELVAAIVRTLALFVVLVFAGPALAQTYPAKPVRIIVPFAAGGPTDVIARIVAARLTESLKQQVYVENLPGAGGNTGTATAAKAPADGHTLLVVSTGFMVNPSLYAKVPYDPVKDFQPLTLVAESPNVLFAHPSVAAGTVKELIDLVKANPGKFSYAQPSTGSTPHLSAELLKLTFGLDMVMVPFTSAALAVNATLAGHTPIGFTALPPAIANIREGKLRGLAVLAARRPAALPNVPTMTEAGVREQDAYTVTGLVMPAGAPKDIVARLNREVAVIGKLPDVRSRLEALGFIPVLNTPEEFGARIKVEMAKWGKVVRDAGLRIE
ncbi:MAG: tripartite tricarboxylate transporter substrate binding protein [Rhizobiales bacterium]|nr:tripartite tricarboxylate transporter substrate binding protein [Hyphomicrobiales bacterium]